MNDIEWCLPRPAFAEFVAEFIDSLFPVMR